MKPIFIPVRSSGICFKKIPCELRGPFFSIADENGTAGLFIDAVLSGQVETAERLVSRSVPANIDFYEVRALLESAADYKRLSSFGRPPRLCKTESLLVINKESRNRVIHVRLVRESDKYSKWKVVGVEAE
ncbi:MAG: hypothetical protein LBU36_08785 [Clostridiales bacterium]|nr:hypothetical protein [Clostridiales bacterium]